MLYVAVCHVDRLIECKRRHHISIVLLIDFHDSWFIQPYVHCIKMWSFIFVQESSSSFTLSFIRSFIFISVAERERARKRVSIEYKTVAATVSTAIPIQIMSLWIYMAIRILYVPHETNKQTNDLKKSPHQIPNKQAKTNGII